MLFPARILLPCTGCRSKVKWDGIYKENKQTPIIEDKWYVNHSENSRFSSQLTVILFLYDFYNPLVFLCEINNMFSTFYDYVGILFFDGVADIFNFSRTMMWALSSCEFRSSPTRYPECWSIIVFDKFNALFSGTLSAPMVLFCYSFYLMIWIYFLERLLSSMHVLGVYLLIKFSTNWEGVKLAWLQFSDLHLIDLTSIGDYCILLLHCVFTLLHAQTFQICNFTYWGGIQMLFFFFFQFFSNKNRTPNTHMIKEEEKWEKDHLDIRRKVLLLYFFSKIFGNKKRTPLHMIEDTRNCKKRRVRPRLLKGKLQINEHQTYQRMKLVCFCSSAWTV